MDYSQVTNTLMDERCGLYFLAGVDAPQSEASAGIVTIHAAEGTLNQTHRRFIKDTFAARHPDYGVQLRFHSSRDLHAPDSLERFAGRFRHDHIVSDPTGAFARVSKLLELAGWIRTAFGPDVDRILWQADHSTLVVLATSATHVGSASAQEQDLAPLRRGLQALIEAKAPADLKKAIRSVQVSEMVPPGRHTQIDGSPPVALIQKRSVTGMLARLSGIAALIGLGTISAAAANAPAAVEEDQNLMPGITGLIGLTTLGENSYGLRNRYQAVGGLRLYFGKNGALMAPVASLPEPGADDPQQGDPTLPAPKRIAYG